MVKFQDVLVFKTNVGQSWRQFLKSTILIFQKKLIVIHNNSLKPWKNQIITFTTIGFYQTLSPKLLIHWLFWTTKIGGSLIQILVKK